MRVNLSKLASELRRIRRKIIMNFRAAHRFVQSMLRSHGIRFTDLRKEAYEAAAIVSIAATTLVAPAFASSSPPPVIERTTTLPTEPLGPPKELANRSVQFLSELPNAIGEPSAMLDSQRESALENLISGVYNVPAKAQLEGIRLNAVYGVMAGEQHLPLYPGDTVKNHTSDPTRQLTGMVPGLPAYGYFANSKGQVTEKDVQRERYYIAAQTFLAPGFSENVQKYYSWFQYRKMIVVNADTGSACVVDIADAGPSPFLQRTFGGSNEVLIALDLGSKRKGAVYALFLDDPTDSIPLGPITTSQ